MELVVAAGTNSRRYLPLLAGSRGAVMCARKDSGFVNWYTEAVLKHMLELGNQDGTQTTSPHLVLAPLGMSACHPMFRFENTQGASVAPEVTYHGST